jgi:ABC-type spermidine/putrescine transport system permease subunit II
MMAVAVIKFGAQHAILRLYPFGGDQRALTRFSTNLVYLPMIVSMVIWGVAILGFGTVSWLSNARFPAVLWCAIVTIPLLAFSSQVEMTLRVSERSGLLTATRVAAQKNGQSHNAMGLGQAVSCVIACGAGRVWLPRPDARG